MSHTRELNRVGKLIKPALMTSHRAEVVLDSLEDCLQKAGATEKYIIRHIEVLRQLHDTNRKLQKRLIKTDAFKRGQKVLRPKNIYLLQDNVSNFLFSTRLVAFESNSHTTSSSHRTQNLRRTLEIFVMVPSRIKRECFVQLKMK